MAKNPGAGKPASSDFTTYFSSATQLLEPPVLERDRKRYDDLGLIGAQALSETGFYASIVRGTPAAPAKPAHTTAAAKKPAPSPADAKTANAAAVKPSPQQKQEASAESQSNATTTTSLLNGAAPTMPSSGFEGRFGAWR